MPERRFAVSPQRGHPNKHGSLADNSSVRITSSKVLLAIRLLPHHASFLGVRCTAAEPKGSRYGMGAQEPGSLQLTFSYNNRCRRCSMANQK